METDEFRPAILRRKLDFFFVQGGTTSFEEGADKRLSLDRRMFGIGGDDKIVGIPYTIRFLERAKRILETVEGFVSHARANDFPLRDPLKHRVET